MHVFLAGIMQGSLQENTVHSQEYRRKISTIVRRRFPNAEVLDPWALHPNSPTYEAEQARQTFFHFCEQAGKTDLLIAYLPEASLGTAIEMWEAYRHGVPVITVSPMADNWAIRFLSWRICPSLEDLETLLESISLPLRRPA
jgi:hypothetical protein